MKIIIKVTKEILERSKMCGEYKATSCAIALAVIDLFESAKVGADTIILITGQGQTIFDTSYVTTLPLEARWFIKKFDMSSPEQRILMNPFSFETTMKATFTL